jgi:hypothetical protein
MVERKKTGLAKARKRVSCPFSLCNPVLSHKHFSVHLGQALTSHCYLNSVTIKECSITVLIMPCVRNSEFMRGNSVSAAHKEKSDNVWKQDIKK